MAGSAEVAIDTIVRMGVGRDISGIRAVIPGVSGDEVASGNARGWIYTWRALLSFDVV